MISDTATLTIDMNQVYTGGTPAATEPFHYSLAFTGPTAVSESKGYLNYDPITPASGLATTPSSYTINPNVLSDGTYTIQLTYMDGQTFVSTGLGGSYAEGAFAYRTSLTLTVVPEPCHACALAGLGALALAGLRRRSLG